MFAVPANPLGDIYGNPCLKSRKALIVPGLAGVVPNAATFVEEDIDSFCVDQTLLERFGFARWRHPEIVVLVMDFQDGFPDLGETEPEDVENTVRDREHARRQKQSVGAICFEVGRTIHD